jgi:hypothetical protein
MATEVPAAIAGPVAAGAVAATSSCGNTLMLALQPGERIWCCSRLANGSLRLSGMSADMIVLFVQPQRCIVSSNGPGRLLSAFNGNHWRIRSDEVTSATSCWATRTEASLHNHLCQKIMTTEVHIGSIAQQACIS